MTASTPDIRPTDIGPTDISPTDIRWMGRALELAERGRGMTSPNPAVGAVVVADGRALGEGFHARAGAPHAEVLALAAAGALARGADLYITLEPCNHAGRTAPCVDAILRAGVRRVVAAVADPNPKVTGGGARALAAAGLAVTLGCREREAIALNRAFFTVAGLGRPHVTLKWAATMDGKTADHDHRSRWITGEGARAEAHRLRSAAMPSWWGSARPSPMIPPSTCAWPLLGRASRCASWSTAAPASPSTRESWPRGARHAPSSSSPILRIPSAWPPSRHGASRCSGARRRTAAWGRSIFSRAWAPSTSRVSSSKAAGSWQAPS